MKAQPHPLQAARLAALRAYDVLDTPRESDFDEIVQLAAAICGTPIAVVNLIDAGRQWFKAEIGLGVRETPIDTSICSHAILDDAFVEIPDTLLDPRMADNPLCTSDPGLRFYAGAQLRTPEGLPIGTLCVLDHAPGTLTPLQRDALRVLARQVMTQLDLRAALQRQVLLKGEIDHRVKNSLQSVAAMVRLQLRGAQEPALRSALQAVEQRIRTVSLIHEELYLTNATDTVDTAAYLGRLRELLQASAPDNVDVAITSEAHELDSQRASAIGVIVNEMVANAVKYAFPDGREGRVDISLRTDGDHFELLCRDDGVGADDSIANGLGKRVIAASAVQLGGVAEFLDAGPGYGLRVVFPR